MYGNKRYDELTSKQYKKLCEDSRGGRWELSLWNQIIIFGFPILFIIILVLMAIYVVLGQ